MSFIIWYWVYNTQMVTWIVLWPGYVDNKISCVFIFFYWLIATNCLLCLFKASSLHPGRVPAQDNSSLESQDWTYCKQCCIMRPPRAHHCRRCQHCVARMDHHCPWINNCVGDDNHYAFVQLCSYAFALSIFSFVIAVLHFYVYLPCTTCDQESPLIRHQRGIMISVVVMGLLMTFFMFCMLIAQHFNFITDRTTLQNIIEPPHIAAEFVDKPCMEIYEDHCGPGPCYKWIWPCHKRPPAFVKFTGVDI